MNLFLRKLSLILAFSQVVYLHSHAYFIDYVKIQHAGEIGTVAVGVGKQFTKTYSLDFFHGRVPQGIGGVEIDTYALKNNFNLFTSNLDPVSLTTYLGINIYHVTGLDYQASRHASYPDDYYRLGSIRGLFYLGEKVSFGRELKNEIYFEAGLGDIVLVNYFNNKDTIDPLQYFSLGIGYTYIF